VEVQVFKKESLEHVPPTLTCLEDGTVMDVRKWRFGCCIKKYQVHNDFTPEEEAQIKKENEWAEDR